MKKKFFFSTMLIPTLHREMKQEFSAYNSVLKNQQF